MATKYVYVNLDFNGNQVINVRAEVCASNPTNNLFAGRFIYRSDIKKLYLYNGTSWLPVGKDYTSGAKISINNDIISHDTTARSDTASSASPAHGGTFTVIDSVTQDATGHITGVNVKTVTLPSYAAGTGLSLNGNTFNHSNSINKIDTFALNKFKVDYEGHIYEATAATGADIPSGIAPTKVNATFQGESNLSDDLNSLDTRLKSVESRGRFLAVIDASKPNGQANVTTWPSDPLPYTYKNGDYFIVGTQGTNIPKGASIPTGTTTYCVPVINNLTEPARVGDTFIYDGADWVLQRNTYVLPIASNTSAGMVRGTSSGAGNVRIYDTSNGYMKINGFETKGAMLYASANDTIASLAIGANGSFLKVVNGLPSWTALSASDIPDLDASKITSGTLDIARIPTITTDKINNNAITTDKIAASAVNKSKILWSGKGAIFAMYEIDQSAWTQTSTGWKCGYNVTPGFDFPESVGPVQLYQHNDNPDEYVEIEAKISYKNVTAQLWHCRIEVNGFAAKPSGLCLCGVFPSL